MSQNFSIYYSLHQTVSQPPQALPTEAMEHSTTTAPATIHGNQYNISGTGNQPNFGGHQTIIQGHATVIEQLTEIGNCSQNVNHLCHLC